MGVIEIVKRQEREKGLQKGLQKGRIEERARAEAEKREKERTFIRNLLAQSVFTDEQIAGIAETTVSVVEDVRKELNKNSADSTK